MSFSDNDTRDNRIKFETWIEKDALAELDKFAQNNGMSRSAASRFALLNFLRLDNLANSSQYQTEDHQIYEMRAAIFSLQKEISKSNFEDPALAAPIHMDDETAKISLLIRENTEALFQDSGFTGPEYDGIKESLTRIGLSAIQSGEAEDLKRYYLKRI